MGNCTDGTNNHILNGLRARNDRGQMVCAKCGRGYDDGVAPNEAFKKKKKKLN